MKQLDDNSQESIFYDRIISLLEDARKHVAAVVNTAMVYSYYEIGRMIVEQLGAEERADYGTELFEELSKRLTDRFGHGFSVRNLKYMRQFYRVFSQSRIRQTVFAEFNNDMLSKEPQKFSLSWSHYLLLMRIDNAEERSFYEIEAVNNGWSLSELKRQFNSALYERLSLSRDKEAVKKLSREGQVVSSPEAMLKDPYVLEFLGLPEQSAYSETELETRIIDNLQKFLLELGKGFAFVGRQVRFSYDEDHFIVDLVFYNRLLRCFVLFDLKIGKLTHQDLGQMQMYVHYYDRKMKLEDENSTIGILLCRDKNDAVVEMTLPEDNKQIFASKYMTVLPSKEELRRLMREGEVE